MVGRRVIPTRDEAAMVGDAPLGTPFSHASSERHRQTYATIDLCSVIGLGIRAATPKETSSSCSPLTVSQSLGKRRQVFATSVEAWAGQLSHVQDLRLGEPKSREDSGRRFGSREGRFRWNCDPLQGYSHAATDEADAIMR